MAQSRTVVNDKAAKGEGSRESIGTDVTYGTVKSKHNMGGPTNQNERPDDNSTKLNIYTPGQSKTEVNNKAKSGEGSMESVPDSVLPYPGSYDGSSPGRSGPGPESIPDSVAYGATKKGSPSAAVKTVDGGVAEQHVAIDNEAQENLEELSDAQNASDDFKSKAKVIFESALNQKLQMEVTRLEEEFSTRFEQEIVDIAEKVEGFLNYTSQQWLEENQLVVENGIRNELSESFMQGLKGLFEDHYRQKLNVLKESFAGEATSVVDSGDLLQESAEALEPTVYEGMTNTMASYARALSRTVKN